MTYDGTGCDVEPRLGWGGWWEIAGRAVRVLPALLPAEPAEIEGEKKYVVGDSL